MPLIPHRLHVYQKPAIGDSFQKAYTALNYGHKISAQGGFDSARCSLAVDRNEAENIFRNYLGNRVAVYVDNPVEPIWEGFINRVNLNTGSVQLSASLDKMTNRVLVQWSTGQGRAPAQTAESTDADSIATYGSKMVHIDLGELYTTNTGLPEAVRDAIIAQRYTPPVSAIGAVGQASGLVEIEMLGFYHTLKWDTFNVVTADATDIPRKLLTTTSPSFTYNSGVFYDDSDTSRVDATTSFTAPGTRQAGESTWDMALKIVEASPSGNRYVCGISPTSPNTGERIAFFEAANETVEYAVDAYGDGRLTNLGGLPVNPWDVRPNRSVLLRNILLGEAETFATGKIAWIKAINYDAESQTVSWETDDDTSLPGVFYLNTQEKATNVPMSAPRRQIVTDDYDIDTEVVREWIDVGDNPDTITNIGTRYIRIGEDAAGSTTIPNGELILGHVSSAVMDDILGALSFYSSDASTDATGRQAAIKALSLDANGVNAVLAFFTGNGTQNATVERMRLSNNALFLGLTAPDAVTGIGSKYIHIGEDIAGSSTPNAEIVLGHVASAVTGDILGRLSFYSSDESSSAKGIQAAIWAAVDEAAGRNSRLVFGTGLGSAMAERFAISPGGVLSSTATYANAVGGTNRAVLIDNTNIIGTAASSRRFKSDIDDMTPVDWLFKLRPVTFTYKHDPGSGRQYGLIAEEVEEVNKDFVGYDDEGNPAYVGYHNMVAPLIQAVQELNAKNEALETRVSDLERRLAALETVK